VRKPLAVAAVVGGVGAAVLAPTPASAAPIAPAPAAVTVTEFTEPLDVLAQCRADRSLWEFAKALAGRDDC
jgi:hypothetical protein